MKKYRKINLLLIMLSVFMSLLAQKNEAIKDTENWRYEIESVGTGVSGTYLLKVWSYSKKPDVAIEQAKRNAIHGVIFRGFEGKSRQKPLASNPNLEQEKAEFFKEFFADGGKYMKFISLVNNGAIAGEDRMKIGKEYKIGVVVSVNSDLLRKDLEDAGIIKGLGSIF